MSLDNSDSAPPKMAPESLTAGSLRGSTKASTATVSGNFLHVNHSAVLTGLNKFEIQSTKPDIAEITNDFHTMFNPNQKV